MGWQLPPASRTQSGGPLVARLSSWLVAPSFSSLVHSSARIQAHAASLATRARFLRAMTTSVERPTGDEGGRGRPGRIGRALSPARGERPRLRDLRAGCRRPRSHLECGRGAPQGLSGVRDHRPPFLDLVSRGRHPGGKARDGARGAARDGRFEDEGWRLRKDGTRFWANVVITALRDDRGEVVGFAKVTRDLTERRAAETQAVRLAAEFAAREAPRLVPRSSTR